jgi:non-specific serine/threonine protein kinase
MPQTRRLTTPGTPVGTLAYMSPEQARAEEVDARTDLFSLGAVLYEMAGGRQAFTGAAPALVSDAVLHQTPPPLSLANPEVPAGLERLITRLLEKNREQRYQSAADVRADLQRLRRQRTIAFPDATRPRRPFLFYGLALLVLGICAGGATAWTLSRRVPIHSVAVLPFDNLSVATLPDAVAAELMDSTIAAIMRRGNLTVVSRTSVLSYKAAGKTLPEIGREFHVQVVVEGSLLRSGDRLRVVARLVDVPNDKYLWAQTYERDYQDVQAMEDAIAADIATKVPR